MSQYVNGIDAIFKKEFTSYFTTPLAQVFFVIYLVGSSAFTFYLGGLLESGEASLQPFFTFQPWLFLLFIPALSMKTWAEERYSGTIETLLTLPLSTTQLVLGKFLACWGFVGIALLLTLPLWMTVAYLGEPDHRVIFTSYMATWVLSGTLIAVGCCCSAASRGQVLAFISAATVTLLLLLMGAPIVLNFFKGWLPGELLESIASISVLTQYGTLTRGIISAEAVTLFICLTTFFLWFAVVLIERRRIG